ncbi:proton channel OtopLc-like isoform X2 [Toxorhynchites rutilus septentrionalis]|uniref:proton channel OtopLc-like isoform X2 n=1 Tax=Toxorhynchites rutilus septentrionalis TaxID=329112 RepID=UPI002478DBA2|nr:proton channel OtopLc-like isoform X2 [Toxorhynchites rutilus septentrionalis]
MKTNPQELNFGSFCSLSSMESDTDLMHCIQKLKQMATPEFQLLITKPPNEAGTPASPRLLTPNSSFLYKSESRRHTATSDEAFDIGSRRSSLLNGFPRSSRRHLFEFLQHHGSRISLNRKAEPKADLPIITVNRNKNRAVAEDQFSTVISALYAKLLIVIGIALPITEVVSESAPRNFYQGFYLYLYTTSFMFVFFLYAIRFRHNVKINQLLKQYQDTNAIPDALTPERTRLGSFYLRVGAIAFGIGSMVYSGLDFGQYFELKRDARCQNFLIALIPAARMALCILQMQFIFLNGGQFHMDQHKFVSRFGLMHMLATNVCEWLYVIIEEAKHEIVHLAHQGMHPVTSTVATLAAGNFIEIGSGAKLNDFHLNATHRHPNHHRHHLTKREGPATIAGFECHRTNIMGSLVQSAAPFLFPCTIEYSLICAVILFEMWKKLLAKGPGCNASRRGSRKSLTGKSANLLSIDCSNAQRGMFGGILVIVLTIIVLIMYFVLHKERYFQRMATIEVTISEIILYTLMSFAVILAMLRMRDLKFSQKKCNGGISLDCTLLVLAQIGTYIYCMFSIIGTFFSIGISEYATVYSLLAEIISLIQTSLQTLFITNAWWRRCKGAKQNRSKPGREIITFLLVANMSVWFINTLIKTNASFRPTLMNFYGIWAWTIITHVSMPLAIFYRFHSTICLFEIWKSTYKVRYDQY